MGPSVHVALKAFREDLNAASAELIKKLQMGISLSYQKGTISNETVIRILRNITELFLRKQENC